MSGTDLDVGEEVREVFEVLADETRLGILEALADRVRERPGEPALGFAELRRRVGRRDSGNFNYHLQQLVGRFVVETGGGYRLSAAGMAVFTAILAGTYDRAEGTPPGEFDEPCPVCGEPLAVRYEDSVLDVSCPNDHRFRNLLPRGAVADRDLETVLRLMTVLTGQDMELARDGVCPQCYGRLEWSLDPDAARDADEVRTRCGRCGTYAELPLGTVLLRHPAVVSFYYDHGVDVRTEPYWSPLFWRDVEATVASETPFRLLIRHEQDGERLRVVVDETLSPVEIERESRDCWD